MSRGNVFKLSGNMALGGSDYQNVDIDEIKNSLKLLKAKKQQRSSADNQPPSYAPPYSNPQPHSNPKGYAPPKYEYDYGTMTKNHRPSSQKDVVGDYSRKNYGGEYQKYSADNYREEKSSNINSKTPSSYQQRPVKNTRQIEDYNYEEAPRHQPKSNAPKNNVGSRNLNAASSQPPKYDSYQDYGGRKDKQERSIKEVNRQNQVDIVEYDPSTLKVCRMGCGRKFNPDSITKHEANCKKVFQKKRKQFDAQKHRLVDNQQVKMMKQGEMVEKKIEQMKQKEKMPKWKAQSLAFRAVLQQNKGSEVDPRQAAMMKQAEESSMVKCPVCGRKFNETAGPRHIKFCEEKNKKMKPKGKN